MNKTLKKITKKDSNLINKDKQNGITLIALVITIVVLLILASVSISMLTGDNGIITQAKKAKEETEKAEKEENQMLDNIEDYINQQLGRTFNEQKGVNEPLIVTGMKKIMFILPEGNNKGTVIKQEEQGFDNNNWYDYQKSQWANGQTEDGSMWVWIPRYAYKITYKNPNNKSEGGTIDVKFLIGTSDEYYDENGEKKTAKRATSATEEIDTTTDYYVHPAFTNESNIKFANGGWDKELTGIWVSKFEAGFASGNNSAQVKASSVNYTQTTAYVPSGEAGTSVDGMQPARNWLDGEYAIKNSDGSYAWRNGEETAIKYPTFQPKAYSMNYINMNDAYNISKVLTESGNIYGLTDTTDSHLMKNSEWGAVAYLSHSKYGTNGVEPYINNINLNNSTKSVYAVTGVTTGTTNAGAKTTTIEKVNGTTGNKANDGIYTWDQIEGQKSSTTRNMYGVYDFCGGLWERTAVYIANENEKLKAYGTSVAYDENKLKTESTKYTTVYSHDREDSLNIDDSSKANYQKNKCIYGDGIRETSIDGTDDTSWNGDWSYFSAQRYAFVLRSGSYGSSSGAGLFTFYRTIGNSGYDGGFRSVLIPL